MAACANTHNVTTKTQGPGVCCAAMPASVPHGTAAIGHRWVAHDKHGKCFVCEVKASTSVKHAGEPVIKRGKSEGLCPTSVGGCCRLLAAA
jgi:hypothetical protein